MGECLLDTELCLVWKGITVSCGRVFTRYIHCVLYGRESLCLVGECLLDTELCLLWKGITVSCG